MPARKKTKKQEAEAKKKKIEESEDEESEEESEEETDDEDRGRGKRKRKSSLTSAFEPMDFTMQMKSALRIVKGRGKKLKEFPTVVSSMEKHSTEDVIFAHRFLFGNRGGKLTKKQMLENMMEFSGYLEKRPKGYNKDKLEAEEEVAETKYSRKAFKMLISDVKKLCVFFHVNILPENGKALNKDDCIENLLDFLAQPHIDFVMPDDAGASSKKPSKPVVKKIVVEKKPADPFALVRKHKKGKKPSDDAMRQWVQAYIVCFDMDSATTKHAIKTASDKFGYDLVKSKERIKELLAEEM